MEVQLEELKKFIEKYDSHRNMKFSRLVVSPQSKTTQPFGLCYNRGVDFNRGTYISNYSKNFQEIYAPFDGQIFFDKNFMRLDTDFGFSLRFYSILSDTIPSGLDNKSEVKKGAYLGNSGRYKQVGKTVSYIEVIAKKPTVLDTLLSVKYPSLKWDYTTEDILLFCDIHGITHDRGIEMYEGLLKELGKNTLGSYRVMLFDQRKEDYLTFYSYSALFS